LPRISKGFHKFESQIKLFKLQFLRSVQNLECRSLLRVALTFKNRASYIWDGRTATPQMYFIYIYNFFFNKYKY